MRQWRQAFHLEPPAGWLNDPNGLCWFAGRYHVFFQYSPDSAEGSGQKCWGHFESPNLITWQFAGTPLMPDIPADRDGVYSGSALVQDDTLYLFYTGNVKHAGEYDYITAGREANVIRVSSTDGRKMSEKKLLLSSTDYPAECSCHVRDPKVWMENGVWKMVLGARTRDSSGQVLVYHSADGERWEYAATIRSDEPFGYMWECPDAFTLGEEQILSVSPQGLPHEKTRFQNIYQSGWFPVRGALEDGALGDFTEWDMGFDFYAPQTFEAPDGRRLLIGWMGLPDSPYQNPTVPLGWQHCLTVPRELACDGEGRICQRPARELEKLLGESRQLAEGAKETVSLPFALRAAPQGSFSVALDEKLVLAYDADAGLCSLKFLDEGFGGGRGERLAPLAQCREVVVLADTSSLEIYLDGGATVMSTRFYPAGREISLRMEGAEAAVQAITPMEVNVCDA